MDTTKRSETCVIDNDGVFKFNCYVRCSDKDGRPIKNKLPKDIQKIFKTEIQWIGELRKIKEGSEPLEMHPSAYNNRLVGYYHIDQTEPIDINTEICATCNYYNNNYCTLELNYKSPKTRCSEWEAEKGVSDMESRERKQLNVRLHPVYIIFVEDYCYFENITCGQGIKNMVKEFKDRFAFSLDEREEKKFDKLLNSKKIFNYNCKMSSEEGTRQVTYSIDQDAKTFICAYAYYNKISRSEALMAIIKTYKAHHGDEIEAKKNPDYWDKMNEESLDDPAIINDPDIKEDTIKEEEEAKDMKISDKEIESIGELAKNAAKGCRDYGAESVSVNIEMNKKMVMVSVRVVEFSDEDSCGDFKNE